MTFLPTNYEKPATNSKYYKFQSGDNYIRILSDAVIGYLDWDDKQPIRTKERPERNIDPAKPAKHFWAFVIYDYREKTVKILELTQATIQDAIFNLHNDANWGDPKSWDINIRKVGDKMETKYSVMPIPPKPLAPEIAQLYSGLKIDLNQLFCGGDPFNPENPSTGVVEPTTAYTDEITVEDIPM